MKEWKTAILLASLIGATGRANGEVVVSEKDEKISTYCECLVAFPGCESNLLASAAGKPLHSWYQTNYLKKGVETDLNAACYRKRGLSSVSGGIQHFQRA